ncbi:TonB-dependent receptor [Mucilaginibacter sp. SG564]|uniref:SusC/RagA family TonB-linked outer membrane protein n=1 Tax=Mucilaginibacter sp. SG564 TaxID=2587022 RepID=UPI001551BEE3|nr:TonB-dependent receptor [Mucilaginibacter sp. SG564]NOW93370.1 TonB-linked SusC/RagA family outer membrane protein [Mucilaginibacter sp. SG564]
MKLLYAKLSKQLKHSWATKSFCLLLFAVFFQISTLYAQTITVKGKVTDNKGLPLPGASVKVKGTTNGILTNANGDYSITVPDGNAVLVFSFISYQPAERVVGSNTQINITLQDNVSSLNEVVVVGYGETKRKLLSTAVSSVNARQLEDRLVATPGEALVGQVSGVQISQALGDPGAAPVINIRGLGSIGAGNSPLFVVDGYPLNSADDFNNINPADIQTIQVLKDAAAAAIYGSRGGNGIIIVTTKRGKAGTTKFNFTSNTGVANASKEVAVLNKDQYVDYVKDAFANSNKTLPAIYNDPSALPNTNWQDQIFRRGWTSAYALSASGGSDKVTFNVTGSYYKQTGIIKNTDFNRYNLRASMDAQLSRKLKFNFNVAPSYAINDQTATGGGLNNALINGIGVNPSGVGGTVISALLQPPILPVRQPNGDYSNATAVLSGAGQTFNGNPYNPVAVLDLYKDRTTTGRMLANTGLEYQIIKGLSFKSTFGFEAIINNRSWFVPATLQSDNGPTANINNPLLSNVRARTTQGTNYNYVSENTLNYNTKFGKNHSLTLLAGYSFQKNTYTESSQSGQSGTTTNSIVQNPNDAGIILGTYANTANALISAFGRADYNYKDKYILSGSLRTDGSSRFGLNKQYSTFPAISAAWRITEESFMKNVSAISELKLRGSYGVSGNNNIGDYNSQSYATQVNYVFGANNATPVFGFSPSSLANANLTWETNKQTDIGLEIGLLSDRIFFIADAYHRVTSNLLLSRGVPAIYGFATSIFTNIGSVENNGLEFSIRSVNLKSKLKWTTDANISFNKNKVIKLTDDGSFVGYDAAFGYTNSIRIVPGESMSSFYGYKQIGIYKDAADVAASPKWASGGSVPGDVKYADINGDGKIDASDIVNIGSPLPKFTYGITNRFDYKGFNFSFLFQGVYGNKILNSADRYTDYYNGSFNVRTNALNRWRSPDNPGDGMTPRAAVTNPSSTTVVSTRNIFDGSYLRLRNITLGYSLTGRALKALNITSARVFLTAENVATFTKYFGYNPEVNVWAGSPQPRYGVDQGTYPLPRTFSLGLNIGF